MADRDEGSSKTKRVDAQRNERALLDAAAAVFVASGVDAPVRAIAAEAGVGVGTIYRHFPTRPDLIVAVYRHQVEACAEAGPRLLAESPTTRIALERWVDLFVDFLVTKHGLASAMRDDRVGSEALHTYFVDRLVPVCESLLDAACAGGAGEREVTGYAFLRGIGNLCIGAGDDSRYDPRLLARLLVAGVIDASSSRSATP